MTTKEPTSRRPKQPDQVRKRLFHSATTLLSTGQPVSIGAIASAAGVSKGAVQHHFGTKEQLLSALFDLYMDQFNEALALGQSKTSALPYLAEMAFTRRDFPRVKTLMGELSQLNLASKTRAIEDFWAVREKDINFNDRRYLPHI